jgi:hypothetical protein
MLTVGKRKDYRKFLVTELNKKRYNRVYDGKSILEKYEEAVENKKVFSNKPFWKLEDEDELDELLKLREEINMYGDGNCTTYVVISQLYPQSFGGYRLKPGRSPHESITKNPEVMKKVEEIRLVADRSILNAEDASAFSDGEESVGDMAKHPWMSINHAPGIAAHYNRVIVVINPTETERMTSVFFSLPGCDLSSYYVTLKDKFSNDININQFLKYANKELHMNLTGDTTAIESMRIALRSGDTIAYTTQGMHSKSSQMWDREGLKDYVSSVFPQVSKNSIAALSKEIPAVISDNELSVTKEKVNVNTDRVMTTNEVMKYLMIIDYYKLPYSIDDFIYNKKYRRDSIKQGGLYQYLKTFDKENITKHENNKFEEYYDKMSGL